MRKIISKIKGFQLNRKREIRTMKLVVLSLIYFFMNGYIKADWLDFMFLAWFVWVLQLKFRY